WGGRGAPPFPTYVTCVDLLDFEQTQLKDASFTSNKAVVNHLPTSPVAYDGEDTMQSPFFSPGLHWGDGLPTQSISPPFQCRQPNLELLLGESKFAQDFGRMVK
ncbi:MAG: hypothetical protein ACK8QZ_08530, partial [Anaerolineales bacterium]